MGKLGAIFVICIITAGCGGVECSRESRDGIYTYMYEELDGSCGYLSGGTTEMKEGTSATAIPIGCHVNYSTFSDDFCSIYSSITCTNTDIAATFTAIGEVEQMDDDGEQLSGTVEFSVVDSVTREPICAGKYLIEYNRISD